MNAFTKKPDTSWLKKADLHRRNSVNSSKALGKPTASQRSQFGILAAAKNTPSTRRTDEKP